jgi:hypothetical protein
MKPTLEVIWRDSHGVTNFKTVRWHGPTQSIDLDGYMLNFISPKRTEGSLVGAASPLGSGGTPTAPPSAPSSECLAVPTQPDPRRKDSIGPEEDPPNVTRVGTGHPHHGIS